MLQHQPPPSCKSEGTDFEPDDEWKCQLKKRIKETFKSLQDAEDCLQERFRSSIISLEQLNLEYNHEMNNIKGLVEEQYQLELTKERNKRRWSAREQLAPGWNDFLHEKEQKIMNGIKQRNNSENSARRASKSPTDSVGLQPSSSAAAAHQKSAPQSPYPVSIREKSRSRTYSPSSSLDCRTGHSNNNQRRPSRDHDEDLISPPGSIKHEVLAEAHVRGRDRECGDGEWRLEPEHERGRDLYRKQSDIMDPNYEDAHSRPIPYHHTHTAGCSTSPSSMSRVPPHVVINDYLPMRDEISIPSSPRRSSWSHEKVEKNEKHEDNNSDDNQLEARERELEVEAWRLEQERKELDAKLQEQELKLHRLEKEWEMEEAARMMEEAAQKNKEAAQKNKEARMMEEEAWKMEEWKLEEEARRMDEEVWKKDAWLRMQDKLRKLDEGSPRAKYGSSWLHDKVEENEEEGKGGNSNGNQEACELKVEMRHLKQERKEAVAKLQK